MSQPETRPREPLSGSVVVPAHDEAATIQDLLRGLEPLLQRGVEIVVAANGCSDATAALARQVEGVQVLELPAPSKSAALNAAEQVLTKWPRLYLDADVLISQTAVETVFSAFGARGVLAARPTAVYDVAGADPVVRAYYRARSRMPSMHGHLWGAGAYALSQEGHDRLGTFPDLVADDLFVDHLFSADEVAIVECLPVQVRVPRRSGALLRTLGRVQRGRTVVSSAVNSNVAAGGPLTVLRAVRSPTQLPDAAVYATLSLAARVIAARSSDAWARDETTRADAPRATGEAPAVDHVVLTRFNVPTPGVESLIRAQDGWLRKRVELFETYTLPSMLRQQVDATWLVYVDPKSPLWFTEWLAGHSQQGRFVAVPRESVSRADLVEDLRTYVPRISDRLLTTNLDNDDAVADDFLLRVQRAVGDEEPRAVYLSAGLVLKAGSVYLRHDPANAFCSVVESWDDPRTCWTDWHTRLGLHMPVVAVGGPPSWLQVVHSTNVSNRVVGRRVAPAPERHRFGSLLDGLDAPSCRSLAVDAVVRRPARLAREAARSGTKTVVLRAVGPRGLDRLKEVVGRAVRAVPVPVVVRPGAAQENEQARDGRWVA